MCAVVLPDVSPQIVFSVVSTVTHRARPPVLGVDVSLEALLVVICLFAMNAVFLTCLLRTWADV